MNKSKFTQFRFETETNTVRTSPGNHCVVALERFSQGGSTDAYVLDGMPNLGPMLAAAPEMYSKLDAIILRLTELNTANALPNDRRLNTLIREGFDLLQKIEGTNE